MKPRRLNAWLAMAGLMVGLGATSLVEAGETFAASIKAAEALCAQRQFPQAIAEFDVAAGQAANNTELGLALGKKALLLAHELNDGAAARPLVDRVLGLEHVHAVARVTALQVRAECQMRFDKDHAAAIATLNEALELKGVDWAQPTLALMLGDAHRLSEKPEPAIFAYQRVLEMAAADAPVKAVAQLNIGLAQQYQLKQYDAARASYAKAVELNTQLKGEVEKHLAKMP